MANNHNNSHSDVHSHHRANRNGHPHADRQLIAIGGHEDRTGEKHILDRISREMKGGKLVVATVASEATKESWEEYKRAFHALGIQNIEQLTLGSHSESFMESKLAIVRNARAVFFTGGDQLRITAKLGGTPLCDEIREVYMQGGIIAGTSAGASVLTETMLVGGESSQSHRIGTALKMAPGLGLIQGLIIDQHFAERGRIGRLLGAVAQNPRILGIGLDENTAIIIREETEIEVLGDGAVYIVDGTNVSYTNISEEEPNRTMSVFGIKLHVLSSGDHLHIHGHVSRSAGSKEIEPEAGHSE